MKLGPGGTEKQESYLRGHSCFTDMRGSHDKPPWFLFLSSPPGPRPQRFSASFGWSTPLWREGGRHAEFRQACPRTSPMEGRPGSPPCYPLFLSRDILHSTDRRPFIHICFTFFSLHQSITAQSLPKTCPFCFSPYLLPLWYGLLQQR